MKIINLKDVEAKEIGENPMFFGGKVHNQFILQEDCSAPRIQVSNISFAPGARNKFHTHSVWQILYITEGKGIVAGRDREHTVTPGMVVFISPGEEHWHGATRDSSFAHLSIIGQPHDLKVVE